MGWVAHYRKYQELITGVKYKFMTSEDRDRLPAGVYRQLFEAAADPIFVLDLAEGHFIEVNRAACDHLGYSREELLRMGPEHIDDAATMEKIPERIEQLKKGIPLTYEAVHINRDGTHIPVEMHIRQIEHEGRVLALNICRNITERKQAKRALVENIQRYRFLVESIPFCVHEIDRSGRLQFMNKAGLDMLGLDNEENIHGMPYMDVVSQQDSERVGTLLQNAINGAASHFEFTSAGDVPMYFKSCFIPIQDSCGKVIRLMGITENITGRKKAEKELQNNREILEKIFAATHFHVVLLDPECNFIRVNRAYADACGFDPEFFIGKNHFALYPSEELESRFKRVVETGVPYTVYSRPFEWPDKPELGTTYWDLAIYPVKDASGKVDGILFTLLEVTQHKQAEIDLLDSEEKFRRVYENAPVGIAMAGEDQKIFMANAAYCRMFGYSPEELRHLTISDLTHPDYHRETRQKAAAVLGGTLPFYSFEKKYLRKDGGAFWGRITATEVTSGTPGKHYIMGLVEDVTERVEREERRLAEVREQKDILVREVHHRIKNSLQGVVGLLRQYATDHPEVAGVIDGAVGKVYSIAAIHGLQAQKLSEAVNLAFLMEQLVGLSECPIELSNGLSCPVILGKDEAVPIALILNELVTNACKHRSACHPILVNLSGSATGVAVTVANHFEGNGGRTAGQGSGLRLIESLLPRKYASLEFRQEDGIFSASLELSPPIVAPEI